MAPRLLVLLAALSVLAQGSIAQSDVSFEWVTVGDPGNPIDPLVDVPHSIPPQRGAVPYVYSISKYETTIGQYTAFLNAVAKSDPHGLYHSDLGTKDTIRGISRSGSDGNYVYYVKNVSEVSGGQTSANLPVTFVSFAEAVRFVNWLHNGQGNGSTETGAYDIRAEITQVTGSGSNFAITTAQPHNLSIGERVTISSDFSLINKTVTVSATTETTFSTDQVLFITNPIQVTGSVISPTRKPDARFWIPTEDEWYKAAYYDPSPQGPADGYWLYPWRSDVLQGRPANFYDGTYTVTGQAELSLFRTYLTDVRRFSETPSYYGTVNQAGNVEEWTEGGMDKFTGELTPRGGHWDAPADNAVFRMRSYFDASFGGVNERGPLVGFRVATVANPSAGGLRNGDKIRFHPRASHNSRMVGGVFEGGTDGSSYAVLYTITETPPDGWTEVSVDFGDARYFRYRSPDNGYGNVAEIEFYRSGAKVIAAASGTPGSWSGKDNDTFRAALDGNTSTFFDAPQPNGAHVDLDTGQGTPAGTPAGYGNLTVTNATGTGSYLPGQRVNVRAIPTPDGQYFAGWEGFTSILEDLSSRDTFATIPGIGVDLWLTAPFKVRPPGSQYLHVELGSGDGLYPTGTMVTVSANPAPDGREFAGWAGDTTILSNPFLATTTAIVPSMDVLIIAAYSDAGLRDKIRFHPRSGHANRMVGGVFEGTNGDPITGPYTTLYTVTSKPPEGWSEVNVNLGNYHLSDPSQYRYLRYRGPNGSNGNVAEIEFYRSGVKVTATGFGTPGSWSNSGSTFDKALDGDVNTFFDAPNPDGNYVGIDDTGALPFQTDRIRYYPREGFENSMRGGVFEGTNGDQVTGPYVKLTEITNPSPGWNWVIFSDRQVSNFRYLRYRGPDDSHSTVAEVEFYRQGVKATGTAFGTPGSQNNSGDTFEKALDGNTSTFFDAPIASGAFVGIDIGSGAPLSDKIRFYPRVWHTNRMVGGVFEGTNGDPVNGPYETIYTITSNPPLAWNEVSVNLKDYRYLRYRGPDNSFGNVAEIEFYRDGANLTGVGFGTPGSWNNAGSTFEKALDGNLDTFFDASIDSGAYVGINTQ